MNAKDIAIAFDSGRVITRQGFFDISGKKIRSFESERENFKFNDSIQRKSFVVEVVFRGEIIVFLYPVDLLKLGFEAPEDKLNTGAKALKKWLHKAGFIHDVSGNEIEVLFDPRSYMVHAAIQVA